jgi:tRNA dimethylallyltransferase
VTSPPLVVIAGPTASGKSALALWVAERHGGTIINADASQVYRDLRILSARPSPAEEARVPHRLFGYRDGAEACSAASWAADARATIAETRKEGRLPILVGGTGLYLRTLLDGIAPIPDIDPAVRAAVRGLATADAHAALAREDPAAAARLRSTDTQRIARALEVVRSTGRPLAAWHARLEGGIGGDHDVKALVLMPDRDWLHARIDARAAAMLDGGALPEVAALLARALPPDAPVLRAIGVPEIAALLAGTATRDATLAAIALATRRYAKRQATWFRHQPPSDWPRLPDSGVNIETILRL